MYTIKVKLVDPLTLLLTKIFKTCDYVGKLFSSEDVELYNALTKSKVEWVTSLQDLTSNPFVESIVIFEDFNLQFEAKTYKQLLLSLCKDGNTIDAMIINTPETKIIQPGLSPKEEDYQTMYKNTEAEMHAVMTAFQDLYYFYPDFQSFILETPLKTKPAPLISLRRLLKHITSSCLMNLNAWVDCYNDLVKPLDIKRLKIKEKVSKTIILVANTHLDSVKINNNIIPLQNANLAVFKREELLDMLLYLNNVVTFDTSYKVLQTQVVRELASR